MFERTRTNQGVDRALGKPFGASRNPWVPASPQQRSLTELRKKALAVGEGSKRFTAEEIQDILATLVRSSE